MSLNSKGHHTKMVSWTSWICTVSEKAHVHGTSDVHKKKHFCQNNRIFGGR